MNNPNVTEEAKDDAREAINELEQAPETQETRQSYDEYKGETRTNAGYKATMKSEFRPHTMAVCRYADLYVGVCRPQR